MKIPVSKPPKTVVVKSLSADHWNAPLKSATTLHQHVTTAKIVLLDKSQNAAAHTHVSVTDQSVPTSVSLHAQKVMIDTLLIPTSVVQLPDAVKEQPHQLVKLSHGLTQIQLTQPSQQSPILQALTVPTLSQLRSLQLSQLKNVSVLMTMVLTDTTVKSGQLANAHHAAVPLQARSNAQPHNAHQRPLVLPMNTSQPHTPLISVVHQSAVPSSTVKNHAPRLPVQRSPHQPVNATKTA